MKKDISIREQLGLTQDDMAMYLQVSRGQLALYEIHKRDLPNAAKLKLAEIKFFLSLPTSENGMEFTHLKSQQEKMLSVLEHQLIIAQHKQIILQRKLETIEKKYSQGLTLLRVLKHLELKEKSEGQDTMLLQVLQSQTNRSIEKYGLHVRVKFQVKLQGIINHKEQIETQILKVKEDLK